MIITTVNHSNFGDNYQDNTPFPAYPGRGLTRRCNRRSLSSTQVVQTEHFRAIQTRTRRCYLSPSTVCGESSVHQLRWSCSKRATAQQQTNLCSCVREHHHVQHRRSWRAGDWYPDPGVGGDPLVDQHHLIRSMRNECPPRAHKDVEGTHFSSVLRSTHTYQELILPHLNYSGT